MRMAGVFSGRKSGLETSFVKSTGVFVTYFSRKSLALRIPATLSSEDCATGKREWLLAMICLRISSGGSLVSSQFQSRSAGSSRRSQGLVVSAILKTTFRRYLFGFIKDSYLGAFFDQSLDLVLGDGWFLG